MRRRRPGQARRRAWLPIAASLALLAMLGASERADLLGYLFGLLVGLAVGVTAALGISRPPGGATQGVLALGAAAAVVGCWLLALE